MTKKTCLGDCPIGRYLAKKKALAEARRRLLEMEWSHKELPEDCWELKATRTAYKIAIREARVAWNAVITDPVAWAAWEQSGRSWMEGNVKNE